MGEIAKEQLDKLEAAFAKLTAAADNKSLLKKHLTKEIFDKIKSKFTLALNQLCIVFVVFSFSQKDCHECMSVGRHSIGLRECGQWCGRVRSRC